LHDLAKMTSVSDRYAAPSNRRACRSVSYGDGFAYGFAYADLLSDGKRETCPRTERALPMWLRGYYYDTIGIAPRHAPNLTELSGRSKYVSPNRQAASTWISPMNAGALSRLVPTGGESLVAHQCAFVDQPACLPFRHPSGEGQLTCLHRFSTCRRRTISS
jgi:hypothetical protein